MLVKSLYKINFNRLSCMFHNNKARDEVDVIKFSLKFVYTTKVSVITVGILPK